MNQQNNLEVNAPSSNENPIKPGTFQSILPILDDLLGILYTQATSEGGNKAQAGESVAAKAKELATTLENMKLASMELPGGNLSINEIRKLSEKLDEEAEKRIQILKIFEQRQMPLTDQLSSHNQQQSNGENNVLPSHSNL